MSGESLWILETCCTAFLEEKEEIVTIQAKRGCFEDQILAAEKREKEREAKQAVVGVVSEWQLSADVTV